MQSPSYFVHKKLRDFGKRMKKPEREREIGKIIENTISFVFRAKKIRDFRIRVRKREKNG